MKIPAWEGRWSLSTADPLSQGTTGLIRERRCPNHLATSPQPPFLSAGPAPHPLVGEGWSGARPAVGKAVVGWSTAGCTQTSLCGGVMPGSGRCYYLCSCLYGRGSPGTGLCCGLSMLPLQKVLRRWIRLSLPHSAGPRSSQLLWLCLP